MALQIYNRFYVWCFCGWATLCELSNTNHVLIWRNFWFARNFRLQNFSVSFFCSPGPAPCKFWRHCLLELDPTFKEKKIEHCSSRTLEIIRTLDILKTELFIDQRLGSEGKIQPSPALISTLQKSLDICTIHEWKYSKEFFYCLWLFKEFLRKHMWKFLEKR